MRKFIVSNFVLTKINDLKLGLTNFALMSLCGVFLVWGNSNILLVLIGSLAATSLFITFVYFRIWPVKWDELGDEQKWNFGVAVMLRQTTATMTPDQYEEWERLNEIYK